MTNLKGGVQFIYSIRLADWEFLQREIANEDELVLTHTRRSAGMTGGLFNIIDTQNDDVLGAIGIGADKGSFNDTAALAGPTKLLAN